MTDPIADFINRLRNAAAARQDRMTVRSSKMIKAITEMLVKKGFIENFEELAIEGHSHPDMTIFFRPGHGKIEVQRMSKPGQRIYLNHKEIKRVQSGLGIGVISTSQGVISDEEARAKKIGGEYICKIY